VELESPYLLDVFIRLDAVDANRTRLLFREALGCLHYDLCHIVGAIKTIAVRFTRFVDILTEKLCYYTLLSLANKADSTLEIIFSDYAAAHCFLSCQTISNHFRQFLCSRAARS
jgi:hypothetical protein